MFRSLFSWQSRGARRARRPGRLVPSLEALEARAVPAVASLFTPTTGLLLINGDVADDTVTVSRNAAGTILVNGSAVGVNGAPASTRGGAANVANVTQIQIFGQGGNDVIRLDETNGVLPAVQAFGGAGNDVLSGGSRNDVLSG